MSRVGKKSVLMQILLISNWVQFLTGNTNFNTILQLRKKKKKSHTTFAVDSGQG